MPSPKPQPSRNGTLRAVAVYVSLMAAGGAVGTGASAYTSARDLDAISRELGRLTVEHERLVKLLGEEQDRRRTAYDRASGIVVDIERLTVSDRDIRERLSDIDIRLKEMNRQLGSIEMRLGARGR